MNKLGTKVKNYKCFSNETGFDEIRRVNLIIGRNNTGKSSLLDIIQVISSKNYKFGRNTWKNIQPPQIIFEAPISAETVSQTFPQGTSGGRIGINHGKYGKQYIGRKIKCTKIGTERNNTTLIECDEEGIRPSLKRGGVEYFQRLPNTMQVFLEGKVFRRLLAEREIYFQNHQVRAI